MSEADDVYGIPNITQQEVDDFIAMQRRAARLIPPPPGKISVSVTPTPAAPRRADALADFRFPGEVEPLAELQERKRAYDKAQAAGLIKVYRK